MTLEKKQRLFTLIKINDVKTQKHSINCFKSCI